MVKEVKSFRSDRGVLFIAHRDAVADDVQCLIEEVTGGECDINGVAAAAMVKNAKRFVAVLSQREDGAREPTLDDLLEDLAFARQTLALIRDQEMGAGGGLGPKAVMDAMRTLAVDALASLDREAS